MTGRDLTDSPQVSVVIPNWNGKQVIDVALRSLANQTHTSFEVIVVDNGSADDSVEHIRTNWPNVRLVALPTNGGFSVGVNAGIAAARGQSIALVNNDVELAPDWLEILDLRLRAHPEAGAVVGKLLDFRDRSLLQEAGSTFAWDGTPRQRGRGDVDIGQFDVEEEVFSACAGAALYRRSAFDTVGRFDERYFAYLEDVDWGFRAQLAGLRSIFVPPARAYHLGSVTAKSQAIPVQYLYMRNSLLIILKNYPLVVLLRWSPRLLTDQARVLVRSMRARRGGEYRSAASDVLKMLPGIVRERIESRQMRRGWRSRFPTLPYRHDDGFR